MKKIILGATLLAAATSAMATNVCTGATTATGVAVATAGSFIVKAFTQQCSAKVFLNYAETATAVGVASASLGGKSIFVGSSNGGGVTRNSDCSGTCGQPANSLAVAAAGS